MLEVQGDADGELEELEELEELDELEELEEDGSQPTYSNTSLTLDVLEEAWTLPAEEVFENNDDVVSLRDDLYLSATTPDDEFGHLVGEVTGDKPTPFMPLEDSDVPAIIRRVWRWSGAGFEWERFAGGDSEVDLFRALSDAVTAFDAFTAAILVKEGDTWIGTSSVGFSDSGKDALNFGPDKVLGGEYLGRRELHVLDGGRANPVLREAFHEKDLRFLRTILCVPLLFRKEPAWLLLGLRRDPGNLLQVLEPRTIS